MWKRVLWIVLALTILGVFPAAAQQTEQIDAASFIPADFAGFIRVHIGDDPDAVLRELNIAAFAASLVEPQRVVLGADLLAYDDFIPFGKIFDADTATFTDNIFPWLNGDIVLAYRRFDGAFQTAAEDTLMILPNKDVLLSSSKLSPIVKAQDLLKQELYRDVNVYIGDTTTFAITSQAVFVGTTDTVKAALDIQAGVADRLIDSPIYNAVHDGMTEDALISAYISGDYILPTLNGLLNGQVDSQPILAAFGEALGQMRTDASFEKHLLNGGFDGAGVTIHLENAGATLLASAVLHSANSVDIVQTTTFDDSLLTMIPRSAMAVHTGTSATGLVEDVMTALPLGNFAREIFSGWPLQVMGTDNPLTPAPSALEIQSAASSYLAALSQFNKFDLHKDLLDHLTGNYVIAMIPRPNDPVPVAGIPSDVLIIAQSDDAAAAQNGVSTLLQILFSLKSQPVDAVEGWDFVGVGDGKTVVFRIGTQDNLLVIATGEVDQDAIRAQNGDNRLIEQQAWQDITTDGRPDVYVDLSAFYNTFFAPAGGASPGEGQHTRLAVRLLDQGSGLFEVDLRMVLPFG